MAVDALEKEGAAEGKASLNPYLYSFSTLKNTYAYLPPKHTLLSFTLEEWNKVKQFKVNRRTYKRLEEAQVYVREGYPDRFLEFYRSKYVKAPSLNIIYLIATDACNFGCSYCFIENNFKEEGRSALNFQTAKEWIDYGLKNSKGELRFIFYGGEPLLNKQFVESALEYIGKRKLEQKGKRINVSINTNGSIYSKELANQFLKVGASLSISLDGPKPIHDKCRMLKNKGSAFDTVSENIERYLSDKVPVSLSITITKYNLYYLPQIAKWVVDNYKGRINGVGFNPPVELGSPAAQGIGEEDFWFVMFQIYNAFRIFKKHGIYEDRVMRRLAKVVDGRPHIKDCAGCGHQIVVSANGDIGPCQAFLGSGGFFKPANPSEYSFSKDKTIIEWYGLSTLQKDPCASCPFILLCGGGCPYYAKKAGGSLTDPDKRYCAMMPIMVNEVLKDNFYKKPRALFIDYDDTIMSRPPLQEVFEKISRKFGISYKTPAPRMFFNPRDYFLENGVKEPELDGVLNEYRALREEAASPNGTLVSQLRKITLPKYILTNGNASAVKRELGRTGLSDLFNGIFGNEVYVKPSKEFYTNAFSSTGLQPEEILYIGDSKADIAPIYSLGVRAVLFGANKANVLFDNDWMIDLCK